MSLVREMVGAIQDTLNTWKYGGHRVSGIAELDNGFDVQLNNGLVLEVRVGVRGTKTGRARAGSKSNPPRESNGR